MLYLLSTQYFESLVKVSMITELGLQLLTMLNVIYSHSGVMSIVSTLSSRLCYKMSASVCTEN